MGCSLKCTFQVDLGKYHTVVEGLAAKNVEGSDEMRKEKGKLKVWLAIAAN